jgi:DNA-binding MarR family transcriptional regulator
VDERRRALVRAGGIAIQAYQRSTDAFDDVAATILDINRTDLRCLDWLSGGPMSAGALASATGRSSAATTSMLDRLERKGLIERRSDPTDRRKVLVAMTQAGQRRVGEIYGPLAAEGAQMLARYTDPELVLMGDVLDASREITDRYRARLIASRDGSADGE